MLYTVPITSNDGSIEYLPATRMWLLAVIDVATRTILGYSLTSEQNYSQTDVLAAIKDSIKPRSPIQFTIPGFSYPENGGFPCYAIKDLEYLAYDDLMLETYNTYVDPLYKTKSDENISTLSVQNKIAASDATIILQNLKNSLSALGLSATSIAAFLTVASEILVVVGTITVAIIVAALVAYAVHEIVIGNWSEISAKWDQIKNAFISAFSSKVSSSTMSSAFNNANSTYKVDFITATKNTLADIGRSFGNLKCDDAARAMKSYLQSRNQRGELLILHFPGAVNGFVICKSYMGGNEAISYTGMHQGIFYQGLVFDNIHPYGLPEQVWINDFETAIPIPPNVSRYPF